MRDDEAFDFDPGQRGTSQLPAVLMALAAIAAILIVNSTVLAPPAAASAHATPTASSKSLPAAPNGALRT